jgi:hypothetical protein
VAYLNPKRIKERELHKQSRRLDGQVLFMRPPTKDEAVYTRTERKVIRMRGEAIHLMTQIESFLDIILITSFIKPDYEAKFYAILMWEDFRLSTKVRLFEEIDLPNNCRQNKKRLLRS